MTTARIGLILGVGAMFLLGCASSPQRAALPRTGDPILDGWLAITNGPREDRVLWQYRTALEYLRRGESTQAATLFDETLAVLQGRFGKNAGARRSRSLFSRESVKPFIGEPYERAMAFYYRGLLYWEEGELDNARACFRSAQLEDSDSETKAFANDYVLLDYLDGLASFRLNGRGEDAFLRATDSARLVIPPPYESIGNVLFFTEYGQAPEKYAVGEFKEKLKFRDGGSTAIEMILRTKQQAIHLGAMDDLAFQSSTRGGRLMDHVLHNKAVFKRGANVVGDVAVVSGLILAQNRRTQDAGLGLAAFGLVSKIVSAATTPRADIRTWDNLPKFLGFGAIHLPPGEQQVSVEFLNDQREVLPEMTQSMTIQVNQPPRDTVVFVSQFQNNPSRL